MSAQIELSSSYLRDSLTLPVRPELPTTSFHRLTVRFDPDSAPSNGTLHLDPNSCSLDEFGDPKSCTGTAPVEVVVGFSLIKEKPGKRLFALSTAMMPVAVHTADVAVTLPLQLVYIKEGGLRSRPRGELFLLKADGTVDRTIELH